jgi:EAL domain-containing protein (putative c-di-GMP-specific phosphodiesterase class I)
MGDMHPINDQAMTKGSLEKVSTLGKRQNLQSCLEMVEDEKELNTLYSMIDNFAQGKEFPIERKVVN